MYQRYDLRPKPAVLTSLTCAVCVAIFLGIQLAIQTRGDLGAWGVPSEAAIFQGNYLQLVTSAFVHIEFFHMFFNLSWTWVLGAALERAIGSLWWLMFVLAAAFISSGIQFMSGSVGIGLSGVVYAMFGFAWLTRNEFPEFQRIITPQNAQIFVIWGLFCVVATQLHWMNIANFAHLGGFLFGVSFGGLIAKPKFAAPIGLGLAALIGLSAISLFWNPLSPDWNAKKASEAHIGNNYPAAERYYRQYIAQGGDDKGWALTNLVEVYRAEHNDTLALATFRELKEADPERAKELMDEVPNFASPDGLITPK